MLGAVKRLQAETGAQVPNEKKSLAATPRNTPQIPELMFDLLA
jgi:hypothetical protein